MSTPDTMTSPRDNEQNFMLDTAIWSADSNTGLEQILEIAHLELSDLKGTVLDLGSGSIDRFSRDVAEAGIEVVSIDPKLAYAGRRQSVISGHDNIDQVHHDGEWQNKSVAGLMQELPIKSESIGTIVSSRVIPYIDPAEYPVVLREINRVLAPNGKGYLFPLQTEESLPYDEEAFLAALEKSGMKYSVENLEANGTRYKNVTLEKRVEVTQV